MSSSQDSSFFYVGIVPFEGEPEPIDPYQEWTDAVVASSIEFDKGQVFHEGILIQKVAQPWMLSVLLFGFISLAFSRSYYRKRFSMLFASFLNWKLSKQIIRYENVYFHPVNILLTLNFLFCVPLFFSFFIRSSAENSTLFHFILVFFPLLIYLLLKLGTYKFSAWLFNEKEAIEEYVFQTNLFNKYLGVAYLILTTLLIYSSVKIDLLYYASIITLGLFLLFQIVRGVIIGLERGNNLFFIILYLCTLEILPWLVLGKWINNYL